MQGDASEHSGVVTQRPPSQSSAGPQSARVSHPPHVPPSQPATDMHAQKRHSLPSGQSPSSSQVQRVESGRLAPSIGAPPSSSRCDRPQAATSKRAPITIHPRMRSEYGREDVGPRAGFPYGARRRYVRAAMQRALPTLSIALALVACGQAQEEEAPVDTTPIVGALEIPISRNHEDPQPSGAALIELSPDELRLDHREVIALERGKVPAAEVADHVITKLRQGLTTGAARPRAALWVNANVPYLTLAQVLNTLHGANVREVSFAVRRGTTGPESGWMKLSRWRVVPSGNEPVTFETPARPWSHFVDHWREMYTACRESSVYIDCDGTPLNIGQGGELQVNLWARGQGMKVTFMQVNADEEAEAPRRSAGPALIEGVRAAPPPPEEDRGPIIREGAFNFRHQDSVATESAFSNTVQPVCGAQSCQVVLDADATTPSMRVISMLGAFYANGFAEPDLAFRLPEPR